MAAMHLSPPTYNASTGLEAEVRRQFNRLRACDPVAAQRLADRVLSSSPTTLPIEATAAPLIHTFADVDTCFRRHADEHVNNAVNSAPSRRKRSQITAALAQLRDDLFTVRRQCTSKKALQIGLCALQNGMRYGPASRPERQLHKPTVLSSTLDPVDNGALNTPAKMRGDMAEQKLRQAAEQLLHTVSKARDSLSHLNAQSITSVLVQVIVRFMCPSIEPAARIEITAPLPPESDEENA